MINKGIVEKIYEAANIQRWNDYVRPVELTEVDKQAHKMVLAYVLARFEETERKAVIDWRALIEGGIFEFFQRVILTDLRPDVFHKVMASKGTELNKWILEQYESDLKNVKGHFFDKFATYLLDDQAQDLSLERKILQAAHYLATNWEFRIIHHASSFIYGIDKIKEKLENQIEDYSDLIGVQKIALGKKSFGFVDLCGQLRFQQRWAQSPRLPKTSVLGHLLIVAMFSYFFSVEIGACPKRLYNNYFCALFHDLPEVLTRDIISPIKTSVEGLQEIIKEYEAIQLEEKVLPLLPTSWHKEIKYFTQDEFTNKIIKDGVVIKDLSQEELDELYNADCFAPLDGRLLKACDHLAAFIEASLSFQHGIRSHHLEEGYQKLKSLYNQKTMAGIDFGRIFNFFVV